MTRTLYMLSMIVLTGCITDPGNGMEEVPGRIDKETEEGLSLPTTATVGKPFAVSFTTGGDQCSRSAQTIVRQFGLRVEIEPRDLVADVEYCNGEYIPFTRLVHLQFGQAGSATITIVGIKRWVKSGPIDTVRIVRTVTVQ